MSEQYTGQKVAGCDVTRKIGEGGGGEVYLANHQKFGNNVVLKILSKEEEDEQLTKRFEREIKMTLDLDHENIVKIHDASSDESHYFIIMEYMDGLNLDQAIHKRKLFSYDAAARIIVQVAKGLRYAHSKNIIHRDIKPSNILLDKPQKIAKLCDFGLAKDLTVESNLTQAGMVLGTPNFMSPEQWLGSADISLQSDIFSLGATFYFMVTGHKPFEGESASAIMTNSLFSEAPSPKEFIKNISDNASGVMEKMLKRELEDRYQNMDQVLIDLNAEFISTPKKGFFGKFFGK